MENQIAVLLPHYNNPRGLKLTLQSLLQETENFTVFIFDDGSDGIDEIDEIIKAFNHQLCIVFVKNAVNVGVVKTLNKGLKYILCLKEFSFIARLDAGDICLNNRLSLQKNFLIENEDVGLIASWVRFVDVNRKELFVFKPPAEYHELKKAIYLYNPFIHPSVMFRVEVVNKIGFYPENYPVLEDHAYFFKVIKVIKVAVLKHFLLEYELNNEGASMSKRKTQTKSRIKLLLKEYKFRVYPTIGVFRAVITHIIPVKVLVLLKKYVFYN